MAELHREDVHNDEEVSAVVSNHTDNIDDEKSKGSVTSSVPAKYLHLGDPYVKKILSSIATFGEIARGTEPLNVSPHIHDGLSDDSDSSESSSSVEPFRDGGLDPSSTGAKSQLLNSQGTRTRGISFYDDEIASFKRVSRQLKSHGVFASAVFNPIDKSMSGVPAEVVIGSSMDENNKMAFESDNDEILTTCPVGKEPLTRERTMKTEKWLAFHPIGFECHRKVRDSMLALYTIHENQVDMKGLVNLFAVVVVTQNAQLIISNILKYGIMVKLVPSPSFYYRHSVFISAVLIMHLIAMLAFISERIVARLWYIKLRRLGSGQATKNDENKINTKDSNIKNSVVATPSTDDAQTPVKNTSNLPLPSLRRRKTSRENSKTKIKDNDKTKEETEIPNWDSLGTLSQSEFNAFEVLILGLILICCGLMVMIPYKIAHAYLDPTSSTFLLLFSIAWLLKLISFHHIQHDLRSVINSKIPFSDLITLSEERTIIAKYPNDHLSLKHFLTYLWMPTLCYQFWYPRSPKVRYQILLRHALGLFLSSVGVKIIVEQYMVVIVHNTFTIDMIQRLSLFRLFVHFFERMLRLSVPTVYVWLLIFIGGFHHYMNFLAELTRFGDRNFYYDWWNATGFGEYWRKWNLPVHYFCTRHVYKPLLNKGIPRLVASQIVFTLSSIAHEYLVCAPLNVRYSGLVITAFMMQTPLSLITDGLIAPSYPNFGNAIFWVVFCFTGQPIAILAFYYLWGVKQGSVSAFSPDMFEHMKIV